MPFYLRTEFYTVLVYLLLMVVIGVFFLSRNRGGTDYFAGGRAVPWWVSGISLYMGNFSAWLFTGGAGMIYRTTGYGLLYFLVTGTVAYYLGSQLTAAQWRRSRVISPVQFLRRRFGIGTQQLLGAVTAVVFLAAAGNQLKAIATVVQAILGIDIEVAAIAIGAIVILYTIVGGLWAVVVTDVLQFVVLLAATLLVAPLALALVPGGVETVVSSISFSLHPSGGPPSYDIHFLIAGLISFTLGVAAGQGPRFYCVPDERAARKTGRLAAALFLTTPVLFSIPALVARTLWGPEASLASFIPGADPHEQVFIQIAKEVLPPGLLGIFLAAMFAATMSALDTVYNMVASILSRDVYTLWRPRATDHDLIRVGRVTTLLCGLVTIGLCLFYIQGTSDLFTVMVAIFYVSAPVMAVPILMGFFYRQAPRSAGMAAILWGIATALVTRFLLGWSEGPQTYLTQSLCLAIFLLSPWLGSLWRRRETRGAVWILGVVFSLLVFGVMLLGTPRGSHAVLAVFAGFILVTWVLFSWWFARPEDRSEVDAFYRDLDRPVDVATEVTGSAAAALAVYRLVGWLTVVIAALVLVLMGWEMAFVSAERAAWGKYVALVAILLFLASLFLLAARRARGVASDA
ncbi:MAG: sodium:solute symporter [Planctomycetota bacterium]